MATTELPRCSPNFNSVLFVRIDETNQIKTARTLFDLREYPKAAHTLANERGQTAIFLRNYATYLGYQY